jgi:hypothetical protein
MWMEFWVWSVVCSGAATSASTLFSGVVWGCPRGLFGRGNFWQVFFESFYGIADLAGESKIAEAKI